MRLNRISSCKPQSDQQQKERRLPPTIHPLRKGKGREQFNKYKQERIAKGFPGLIFLQ
jgi:hypothetical protein